MTVFSIFNFHVEIQKGAVSVESRKLWISVLSIPERQKISCGGLAKMVRVRAVRCMETLSIQKNTPYDRQQRQQTITSAQLKNQKNSTCVCLMGPSTRSNRNNNKNNNSNNNNNESHPQELNDYNFHPGAPVVVPTTNYQLLLLFVESNPTRDTHIVSRKNPTIRFCSNLL